MLPSDASSRPMSRSWGEPGRRRLSGSSGRHSTGGGCSPATPFRCLGAEMPAADMMVNAHLGPTQAGEVAFRLVRARAVIGRVFDRMVDPHHREAGVQDIPGGAFVRVYGRP